MAPENCAYCGGIGPLTKEHLWPHWLHAKTSAYQEQFLLRSGGFVGGEPTVRDVCATCNNGALSALDAYAARVYDSYFGCIVHAGQTVQFEYDYDTLARWLLKLSFNTARIHRADDCGVLSTLSNFILTGSPRPERLVLIVRLVIPQPLRGQHRLIVQALPGQTEIPPLATSLGNLEVEELVPQVALRRIIGLNSYQFVLLLPAQSTVARPAWRRTVSLARDHVFGGYILRPSQKAVQLAASSSTYADNFEHHFMKHWDTYTRHYAQVFHARKD